MSTAISTIGRRIIVFGRYPVPGATKTRLIPLLGPLGAADFQRRMTEKCLGTLIRSRLAPVSFCYAGGRPDQLKRWLAPYPVEIIPQVRGDLGARMKTALDTRLGSSGPPVVLVGTDIPGMSADAVARAFDALVEHDLVLGPSTDGGYWLVGIRRPLDIFGDMAWGTARVLDQTLSTARRLNLKVHLLDPQIDIDTPEDWRQAFGLFSDRPTPYLSVIIPTLNEAGIISHAIARVRGPDTQIIVADGGSRDATVSLARRAGVRVMTTPAGRACQQNQAAAQALGRVMLFLHADTRLPVDFGRLIFECLLDRRVAAGAFKFKTDLDHWAMHLIEKCAHLRAKLLRLPYGDQAIFMKRRIFHQVGGFPDTPVAEDLLLIRQVARLGSIRLVPAFAVTSARRWRRLGFLRTTLINYLIAGGCLLNVPPRRLALLYQGKNSDRARKK
jgi:rSAM/selenodomain-associated transferase 2/rSAM/selenodomain-associated transferase 1